MLQSPPSVHSRLKGDNGVLRGMLAWRLRGQLREETGVTSAKILSEAPYWLTYDFPKEVKEKLKHQWGSDWKGQAQKCFLFKFTGKEEEINLLGDGTEKLEFGEWSWMSPEQVVDLAVDFKKPVYKEVLTVFSPHLHQNA